MKRHTRPSRAGKNVRRPDVQKPPEPAEADVPRGSPDSELHGSAGRSYEQRAAPHGLRLAPLVGDVLNQWSLAFSQLGVEERLRPTSAPRQGLAVVTDTGVFLAGAGIYDTQGPWVIVDHLATNPMARARLKHQAVMWLGRGILVVSTSMSKRPIAFVHSRGLAMVMLRLGCKISDDAKFIGGIGLRVQ
jgi:hypothetical protein